MRVDSCGVKQAVGEKAETIQSIISETGSNNIPVVTNVLDSTLLMVERYKQISRSDLLATLKLEVSDIAESMQIKPELLSYRFISGKGDKMITENPHYICTVERSKLSDFEKKNNIKTSAMYPLNFVLNRIAEKGYADYVYINIGDATDVICIADGEIRKLETLQVGMKDILSEIATYCGSTAKAYELCKSVNVYTEQSGVNDPEIEKIIEPVLQDLLHRIEEIIKGLKYSPAKLMIGGMGTLFTNIDMLFEEYFNISSKVAKPYFVREDDANISDIIETTEAIALAHEYLLPGKQDVNFVNAKAHKNNVKVKDVISKKDLNVDSDKVKSGLLFANIILAIVIILYAAFSIVYNTQVEKMQEQIANDKTGIQAEISKVESDIQYIKSNTKKYSDINSFVDETVRKIEGNEIGKYSTYNVANFMQKIIKYIPKGVELQTISSDDNKHVTIVAKSESYSGLGYFVSQLKLKEILVNVEVEKVEHTAEVTVTIGGDLP